LFGCPQRKGLVDKVFKLAPRKPCSAKRSTAHVFINNKKFARKKHLMYRKLRCYIPGEDITTVVKTASVLIRAGGPNDLPGTNFRIVHGARNYAGLPIESLKTDKRSKYGLKLYTRNVKKRAVKIKTVRVAVRGVGMKATEYYTDARARFFQSWTRPTVESFKLEIY
jgi:small subunit ribosomal protein S12